MPSSSAWIARVVAERCPRRGSAWTPSTSPEWATDALDQVRREVWNAARKGGQITLARELKGARYALWKNPGDLTAHQRAKLAWIAQVNGQLYRAYLLKEELRLVFTLKGTRATVLLQAWLAWARRCRIPAFVELAKAIARHRADIQAASPKACPTAASRPSTPRSACSPGSRSGSSRPRRSSPWPCSASAVCAHPCPAAADSPSAACDHQSAGGRHRPGVHGDRLQQADPHQRGRGASKIDDRRRGQLLVQPPATAQRQHRPGQPSARRWGIQPGEHAPQQPPHRLGVLVLVGQRRTQTDKLGGEQPWQGPQQRRVHARQVNQRISQLVELLVVVVAQHPGRGPRLHREERLGQLVL